MGDEYVHTSEDDRAHFSQDLSFERLEIAELVVQPKSTDELAGVVRQAYRLGLAVLARGGGLSYTKGYAPSRAASVLVDMRLMNRVVEINVADLYVVAECGCTWEELHAELVKHGVRAPFWGPSSGRFATLGGTLSQNGLYYGSSRYGTAADCTLGLDVVVADGEIIRTGSGARTPGSPFFRYFGPDLTGLFLGDTGALGIKARAVIALVPLPCVTLAASFAFETLESTIKPMREMARLNLAAEIFGLEPFHHRVAADQGFSYLADEKWTLHAIVEGPDEPTTRSALDLLSAIATRTGGREIDSAYALASRLDPFGAIRSLLLGPEGEICLPSHAILPFSRAEVVLRETQLFFEENAATLERHGITTSLLTFVTGKDFLLEPNLYWRDALGRIRLECIEPQYAQRWADVPANPETRAAALALRKKLVELFSRAGAANIQIGKYYDFESVLDPTTWRSLQQVKAVVDPQRLINPGVLGL